MKLINRETIKETVSAKSMTLASVVLTGVIALTATGCDAQIKADGITIDSLTITGSDADGILEGADITINGKNVDLTDIAIPTQAVKQADPIRREFRVQQHLLPLIRGTMAARSATHRQTEPVRETAVPRPLMRTAIP